jgi:hypothetical protein
MHPDDTDEVVVRRYLREIASPRSCLLYEAKVLSEQGDTEVGAAYKAYQQALDHLQEIQGTWAATKRVPDASHIEVEAALSEEFLPMLL